MVRLFENPKPKIEGGGPSECYPLDVVYSSLSFPCALTLPLQRQSAKKLWIYAFIQFPLTQILLNHPAFYLEFVKMDSA